MVYETIRKICEEKDMSISELERKADLGGGTIHKWKVRSPNLATLAEVSKVLHVPLSKLVEDGNRK